MLVVYFCFLVFFEFLFHIDIAGLHQCAPDFRKAFDGKKRQLNPQAIYVKLAKLKQNWTNSPSLREKGIRSARKLGFAFQKPRKNKSK